MRRLCLTVVCALLGTVAVTSSAGARVLRVGTYHGIRGQFRSIQAAVDAAKPGDWILVGPGDYKTKSVRAPKQAKNTPAGVLLTTPDLYLRGMNRNTVVVDGTTRGPKCNSIKADQNFGPKGASGSSPMGVNG